MTCTCITLTALTQDQPEVIVHQGQYLLKESKNVKLQDQDAM